MEFINFDEVEETKERQVYVEDFSEESFLNKVTEINKIEKIMLEAMEKISYMEV